MDLHSSFKHFLFCSLLIFFLCSHLFLRNQRTQILPFALPPFFYFLLPDLSLIFLFFLNHIPLFQVLLVLLDVLSHFSISLIHSSSLIPLVLFIFFQARFVFLPLLSFSVLIPFYNIPLDLLLLQQLKLFHCLLFQLLWNKTLLCIVRLAIRRFSVP